MSYYSKCYIRGLVSYDEIRLWWLFISFGGQASYKDKEKYSDFKNNCYWFKWLSYRLLQNIAKIPR